jgi:type II secretory pathway component GspD/PulD (secretin)
VAVPDLRTGSVVVSAARDLMGQIAGMIEDLDSDPARKQQVFVFDVQNTDPQAVQEILQGLFPAANNGTYGTASSGRNSRQQAGTGNQLNNRATQNQNRGGRVGTGTGGMNSGFGNTFGGNIR